MPVSTGRLVRTVTWLRTVGDLLLRSSLWLIQAALMLASSGIDGEYMSGWMPAKMWWMGYALNAGIDATTSILMYWFGVLQRDSSSKKRVQSRWLLVAEGFSVVASWFLTWRQLRRVLPAIEPEDWEIISALSAAIVPVFLAFIGYCQSLLARKVELPKTTGSETEATETLPAKARNLPEALPEPAGSLPANVWQVATPLPATATLADWRSILPHLNGERAEMSANDVAEILTENGYALPSDRTLRSWAHEAREST